VGREHDVDPWGAVWRGSVGHVVAALHQAQERVADILVQPLFRFEAPYQIATDIDVGNFADQILVCTAVEQFNRCGLLALCQSLHHESFFSFLCLALP